MRNARNGGVKLLPVTVQHRCSPSHILFLVSPLHSHVAWLLLVTKLKNQVIFLPNAQLWVPEILQPLPCWAVPSPLSLLWYKTSEIVSFFLFLSIQLTTNSYFPSESTHPVGPEFYRVTALVESNRHTWPQPGLPWFYLPTPPAGVPVLLCGHRVCSNPSAYITGSP